MTSQRQPRKVECRPVRKGNPLRGFVSVAVRSRAGFPEVAIHSAGSCAWTLPTRRALLNREGTAPVPWQSLKQEASHARCYKRVSL